MTNKPLHYELVDLLGDADMPAEVLEAIRVILPIAVQEALGKNKTAELKEIEALTHDLERVMDRENKYLNALMEITGLERSEATEIATKALYGHGPRRLASVIEAQRATTVQQGVVHESAVGVAESPSTKSGAPDNG